VLNDSLGCPKLAVLRFHSAWLLWPLVVVTVVCIDVHVFSCLFVTVSAYLVCKYLSDV